MKDSANRDLERLITRLRKEKARARKDWERLGFLHGEEDALELPYAYFKEIEEVVHSIEWRDRDRELSLVRNFYSRFWQLASQGRREELEDLNKEGFSPGKDKYIGGWGKGVMHVWMKIKDKI